MYGVERQRVKQGDLTKNYVVNMVKSMEKCNRTIFWSKNQKYTLFNG